MAFKVLDTHSLLHLILLFVLNAAQISRFRGQEEVHRHCIPEGYSDMVECCDGANDAKKSSERNAELIGSLGTRLNGVESSLRNSIVNVSKQFSLKLSEVQSKVPISSVEGYEKEIKAIEQRIESLRSENDNHNSMISQMHTRLDAIAEEIKSTKRTEELTQSAKLRMTDARNRLTEETSATKTQLGTLKEGLNELQKTITKMNSDMLRTEPDLRALIDVIDNFCLPPFAWQGDGCYYTPYLKKSWQEARSFCKDLSADLVVPRDYLVFVNWLSSLDFNDDVWVGASDIAEEDNWVWVNGNPLDIQPTEFIKWKVPSTKDEEDCLEICSHAGYKPSDMRCGDENYFVCQKSVGMLD